MNAPCAEPVVTDPIKAQQDQAEPRTMERGDPDFQEDLVDADYDAPVERAWFVDVATFDWNCSKHITQRFIEADITPGIGMLITRFRDLGTLPELAACSKPE